MRRTQASLPPPVGRKALIRLADAYRKSPNCTEGSPAAAALSPCVFLLEHVASKRRPEGGVKTLPSYYLTLRAGQSAPQETEITDSRCWNKLAAGDTVTAQVRRGQIMSISAQGCRSQATNNPLSSSSDDNKILLLTAPFTLLFVTTTIFLWKKIISEKAA